MPVTGVQTCALPISNGETWRGLGKNATEGLAAPATIVPMTLLLLGGQVLPFILLVCATKLSSTGFTLALAAVALAYAPRLLAVWRFRQPLGSALLHPLGMAALLGIQWHALVRQLAGKPSVWKGRSYGPTPAVAPAKAA